MKTFLSIFSISLLFICISSCTEEMVIPKPPTYLRSELPSKHNYITIEDDCPYSIEINDLYTFKAVPQSCHKDIELGPLNGIMHFSYIEMTEPLKTYIDYALTKVDEHKVVADAIDDEQILRPESNVFGTFFELKGNVASPFQFYLTDSTSRFVSGVIYFNSKPNYDSLKPSLEYLKKDVLHLMNTFEWDK